MRQYKVTHQERFIAEDRSTLNLLPPLPFEFKCCSGREGHKATQLHCKAHEGRTVSYHASVETIFVDVDKGRDCDKVNAINTYDFVNKAQSVLIMDPSGTGKSYIAPALCTNTCLAFYRVLHLGIAKLLEMLHLARIESPIASYFDNLAATELLIIDHFGMKS